MNEKFKKHLDSELEKYKGIFFPIKSSAWRRFFTKTVSINKLHPNPEDEFCKPEVGPSDRIITKYTTAFGTGDNLGKEEPLIVERMHPDGYLIANGHHRWAAYYITGRKRVPVELVNLTHEKDLLDMINSAQNDRRITVDLDEVVFCKGEDGKVEKRPAWPHNRYFKEDIRLGVPALFHYAAEKGYDIWVFSSKFYSIDYVTNYLKLYHVKINGIVTATVRQQAISSMPKSKLDKLIADTYKYTLHIDNDVVIKVDTATGDFEEFPVNKEKGVWSDQVMKIIGEMDNEQEK